MRLRLSIFLIPIPILILILSLSCSNNPEVKSPASPKKQTENLIAILDTIYQTEQTPIRLRDSLAEILTSSLDNAILSCRILTLVAKQYRASS